MTDAPSGPEDDGVWMTKTELARARGITLGSVDRLIRKRKWRRQPGNDGRTRILVPVGWESRDPADRPTRRPTPSEEIATLRELLTRSIVLIDGFRAERDRAQQALAGERSRAEELRAGQTLMMQMHTRDLAVARLDTQEAHQAASELRRAEEARKARGLVARLRAAWRGSEREWPYHRSRSPWRRLCCGTSACPDVGNTRAGC